MPVSLCSRSVPWHALFLALALALVIRPAIGQVPELVVQLGHTGWIMSVKASPNGKLLATGSADNSVKIWDLETGKLLQTIPLEGIVPALDFSADGKLLAAIGGRTLVLIRPEDGSIVKRATLSDIGSDIDFGAADSVIAAGDEQGAVYRWNWKSASQPSLLGRHAERVATVDCGRDGEIRTVARDGQLMAWLASGGKPQVRKVARTHEDGALSPDGARYAYIDKVSDDVALVDLRTGSTQFLPSTKQAFRPISLSFAGDGSQLVAGHVDGWVSVWDLPSKAPPHRILAGFGGDSVGAVAVDSGARIYAGAGTTVQIFARRSRAAAPKPSAARVSDSPQSYVLIGTIRGYGASTDRLQFSPDGKWLGGIRHRQDLELWRMDSGLKGRPLKMPASIESSLALGRSDLCAVAFMNQTVSLFNLESGKVLRTLDIPGGVLEMAFDPAEKYLAMASMVGVNKTTVWRTSDWTKACEVEGNGRIALSRDQLAVAGSTLAVWNLTEQGAPTLAWQTEERSWDIDFSPDGTTLATIEESDIKLRRSSDGQVLETIPKAANQIRFAPDGSALLCSMSHGGLTLWNIRARTERVLSSGRELTWNLAWSLDGRLFASATNQGMIRLWSMPTRRFLGNLISLDSPPESPRAGLTEQALTAEVPLLQPGAEWAVVAPDGRFDASEGAMRLMHYVAGLEVIEFEQLKDAYYDPGLLGKLIGVNPEPLRPITPLAEQKLFPKVKVMLDPKSRFATVSLTARGGGIGKAEVRLNGKLIQTWTPPKSALSTATFKVDLSAHANLLGPGPTGNRNAIGVKAFNADGFLASRSVVAVVPSRQTPVSPPHVWGLFVGTSDYAGDEIDLRYAARDAARMAEAVRISAERWVGPARTHLKLLATGAEQPTRKAILEALEAIRVGAKPTDVVVLYFAGHGVAATGVDGDFLYLTLAASRAADVGGANREVAISGEELAQRLAKIPSQRQVLILDTCASGAMARRLNEKRQVSGSLKRSWERIRDRSGTFLLAGCASDAVSYEASRYGQGLLTYSLLEALKQGRTLRQDPQEAQEWFVDVVPWLQDAADRVPALAEGIGGIQRPHLRAKGDARSFDLGKLTLSDRAAIPLDQARPIMVRPSFEGTEPVDSLRLSGLVERELMAASSRGHEAALAFWNVPDQPDAYVLRGRYEVQGNAVTVRVFVFRFEVVGQTLEQRRVAVFEVAGTREDLPGLAARIVKESEARIAGG